ncbi:MAG: UDP-N-acetylmuramoyl-tripeptide--D-alanyl-D-alanine ligase [Desulfuromonadaceae bacterium]|nr:UDP-N-acetylmuramoyl-tripeptide--D-alanyl-D-alanine ligase [Desulfuromonadaceae bacterium]MDD2855839.1 UDP-N-acetylmuramoyl-tripeptide--D-alanyl-D-alanine ligase [Desulfuromonadaceae bacterium]
MFSINEIALATGGRVTGQPDTTVSSVSTDSRSVAPGQLFVPLRGERFNGHDFIEEVASRGVTAVIAEEHWLKSHSIPDSISCVAVKDTLKALGNLAAEWRLHFDLPVIAVTGSNGKTTTKEMLATILQQTAPGLKTFGNLNNLIGLPQMIFQLRENHSWAVLEMGMSEAGEINRLAEIARPRVGIVLNALPAHLQSMGTVEAVAAAKGELLFRISDNGLAVVNADDSRVASLSQNPSARRISFGIDRGEVRAREIKPIGLTGQQFLLVTPKGEVSINLKVCGRHNVYNALAAAAALLEKVALSTIASGLEAFTPYTGRFQVEQFGDITLIDDSYNANPASIKAALETLSQTVESGHRIAVLGDMLELGEQEGEAHQAVGTIAGRNVDRLYLLGARMTGHAERGALLSDMAPESIFSCSSHEDIVTLLNNSLQAGDVVLVKGSRGMTMEKVAMGLKKQKLKTKGE